jgi:hypothetical protein
LVNDCKKYGTYAFANLARSAFISQSILNSLVEIKLINKEEKKYFLSEIKTILSESLYYFSQLTASEAISEALLAYLTLSSSKILSSYINEALDTIIPALSKAWSPPPIQPRSGTP